MNWFVHWGLGTTNFATSQLDIIPMIVIIFWDQDPLQFLRYSIMQLGNWFVRWGLGTTNYATSRLYNTTHD